MNTFHSPFLSMNGVAAASEPIHLSVDTTPADENLHEKLHDDFHDRTDEQLFTTLPPESEHPTDDEITAAINGQKLRKAARANEIEEHAASELPKYRAALRKRANERDRAKKVLCERRDRCRTERPARERLLRVLQSKIREMREDETTLSAEFRSRLQEGGFTSDVPADRAGLAEAIRRKAEADLAESARTVVGDGSAVTAEANPTTEMSPSDPILLPLPERRESEVPSLRKGVVWTEWAITVLLSIVIGGVFGAAVANELGLGTVRDLTEFRSPIGTLFLVVLGPLLLLLVGEGYKYVASELVADGKLHATSTRPSSVMLWMLLAALVVFSVGDVSATALLFRQATEEYSGDMWGRLNVPLAVFYAQGFLFSTPLMIIKVIAGRKRGLDQLRQLEHEAAETQRITHINEAAVQRYREQQASFQARQEIVHSQRVALEMAMASIRENSATVQTASEVLDKLEAVQGNLAELTQQDGETRDSLTRFEGSVALTDAERRELTRCDLATMTHLNTLWRGIFGKDYFDGDAIGSVKSQLEVLLQGDY